MWRVDSQSNSKRDCSVSSEGGSCAKAFTCLCREVLGTLWQQQPHRASSH